MTYYRIHEPSSYFDLCFDLTEASAPVLIRHEGDSDFESTVFETADGRHDIDEIAALIIESEQGVESPEFRVESRDDA